MGCRLGVARKRWAKKRAPSTSGEVVPRPKSAWEEEEEEDKDFRPKSYVSSKGLNHLDMLDDVPEVEEEDEENARPKTANEGKYLNFGHEHSARSSKSKGSKDTSNRNSKQSASSQGPKSEEKSEETHEQGLVVECLEDAAEVQV